MQNLWKKIRERKKVHLVSGKPLIEEALRLQDASPEAKKEFLEDVKQAFTIVGKRMVKRALEEKIITQKEFNEWKEKYGMDYEQYGCWLTPVLAKKDGALPKREMAIIVSIKESPSWKMRSILKKRFGLKVCTPEQVVKELEKDKKKETKKK